MSAETHGSTMQHLWFNILVNCFIICQNLEHKRWIFINICLYADHENPSVLRLSIVVYKIPGKCDMTRE